MNEKEREPTFLENTISKLVVPAIFGGFFLWWAIPATIECAYVMKYEEAKTYAVRQYGDKKPPFTREEKEIWYQDLHVDFEKQPARPEKSKLIEYINTAATKPID